MAKQLIEAYLTALQQSGLLPKEQFARALGDFKKKTESKPELRTNVDALAKYLIDTNVDTSWQNDKLKDSAIQNRGGKLVTVAPKVAANAKAEFPMTPYDKRA